MTRRQSKIAIVGSGLSSALLARELSNVAEVTVFERGASAPLPPPQLVCTGHPLGLFPSFAYGLGGTTNYWHGGLVRMSEDEVGAAWPAGMSQILEERAADVMTRLYGKDAAQWWMDLTNKTERCNPFVDVLVKPRVPFNAARSRFFDQVNLKLRHEVRSIRETSNGVVVQCLESNQIRDHAFDAVVLAAGGINSPLILKRSGLGGPAVCQNLTDHPMGFVAKLTKNGADHRFADLTRKSNELHPYEPMLKVKDVETGLWTSFYLRPTSTASIHSDPYADSFAALSLTNVGKKYLKALSQFGDADFRAQAFAHTFGRTISGNHAYVLAVAEQEAGGQGWLNEGRDGEVQIHWEVSDRVVSSIERSLVRLADWAGGTLTMPDNNLKTRLWSAAHHSGGCRIAEDHNLGAVDATLRVHGTNSIYVCDASVIPSSGASNSGLTIGCLALHLAKQLSSNHSVMSFRTTTTGAEVLLSGAGSNVGNMLTPAIAHAGVSYERLSLRDNAEVYELPTRAKILVHLANDRSSMDGNLALQQKTAAFLSAAEVNQVIIPMSFATLQNSGERAGDPQANNFGFDTVFLDSYISGKLAVERFWTNWQAEDSRRRIAFIYIPTILGPNSAWTRNIASYRPGTPLWAPALQRFFSVTEKRLAQVLVEMCQTELQLGVSRRLIFDRSGTLAEAIFWDRGSEDVREVRCPKIIWRAVELSRYAHVNTLMAITMRVMNKILGLTARQSIVPVDPLYYAVFNAQVRAAETIEGAAC